MSKTVLKLSRWIVLVLVILAVLHGLNRERVGGVKHHSEETLSGPPPQAPQQQTPSNSYKKSNPSQRPRTESVEKARDFETQWSEFKTHFGTHLKAEVNSSGYLTTVRGSFGQGEIRDRNFKTKDIQSVTLRGQEIVLAARGLLGLNSDFPLSHPVPQVGPMSAQLYYQETYRGLRILPEGDVKIDLGPKGELLGLYSNYVSNLKVVSEIHLSPQQALNKVAQVTHQDSSKLSKGNQVVWIVGADQGRVAYQFFTQGREIVVDAGTGEVLFSRDRRQQ